jgi:hypothetical protein
MSFLKGEGHEVSVPDDFEVLSGEERYQLLREAVPTLYTERAAALDRRVPGPRS